MVHRHDGPDASLVLSIGDAIIRHGNTLAFVPDERMGDDADAVKRGLRAVFERHLAISFDNLLFAHGEPWIEHAASALKRFLAALGFEPRRGRRRGTRDVMRSRDYASTAASAARTRRSALAVRGNTTESKSPRSALTA